LGSRQLLIKKHTTGHQETLTNSQRHRRDRHTRAGCRGGGGGKKKTTPSQNVARREARDTHAPAPCTCPPTDVTCDGDSDVCDSAQGGHEGRRQPSRHRLQNQLPGVTGWGGGGGGGRGHDICGHRQGAGAHKQACHTHSHNSTLSETCAGTKTTTHPRRVGQASDDGGHSAL
jgi:hypothetical protein